MDDVVCVTRRLVNGARSATSAEVLVEKFQRSGLRELIISFAEAAAFVATKTMARTLIDIRLYFGLRSANRFNVTHRNRGVCLTEVHLHRAMRPFIFRTGNPSAVPAA